MSKPAYEPTPVTVIRAAGLPSEKGSQCCWMQIGYSLKRAKKSAKAPLGHRHKV